MWLVEADLHLEEAYEFTFITCQIQTGRNTKGAEFEWTQGCLFQLSRTESIHGDIIRVSLCKEKKVGTKKIPSISIYDRIMNTDFSLFSLFDSI